MSVPAGWLAPAWRIPGVGAVMTTRAGGTSTGRFATLNLRDGVGDDPAAVRANQRLLGAAIGAAPVLLEQVHGARVVGIGAADAQPGGPVHVADASVTGEPGIACVVHVADCLPVLLAARNGRAVGAAHAGWRGLAAGVLEATVREVSEAAACAPGEIVAWLGACIGPASFEVGADVLEAFGVSPAALARPGSERFRPGRAGKWWADLPMLAHDRLRAAGVATIDGGRWCTVADASRFFSFRRDGVTGRMAAAVWLEHRRGE